MATLDELIVKNVESRSSDIPFTPGAIEDAALAYTKVADAVFGEASLDALYKTEATLLTFLTTLYRSSDPAPHAGLTADEAVTRELLQLLHENVHLADPTFLVLRYTLKKLYEGLTLAEPTIELGLGHGDTTHALFGDRRFAVGTTPIIDALTCARDTYGNHDMYCAVDAASIPFEDRTFGSVFMNYTFYHLQDPNRSIAEVFRVLDQGGTFALNTVNDRRRFEDTRLLPGLAEHLGLPAVAQRARDFIFSDFGNEGLFPGKNECVRLLEARGFVDIRVQEYVSPALHKMMYLVRDLEVLFALNLRRVIAMFNVQQHYEGWISEVLAPLLTNDAELCVKEEGGIFSFITARKPGELPERDETMRSAPDHLICPTTREKLVVNDTCARAEKGTVIYPVYDGMPLLIPIYAELWARQNRDQETNRSRWQPFVY